MSKKVSSNQIEREALSAEREKRLVDLVNQQKKKELISELKNGLGEAMKQNPSNVEFVEKPKITFKQRLINFFNRF